MAKKKETKKVEATSTAKISDYALLKTPLVTEKSSRVSGVVFKVRRDATKIEIRGAVERVFNVSVAAVRTCNYQGKAKRTARSSGRRVSFKKAYITLKEGQSINIVEGL